MINLFYRTMVYLSRRCGTWVIYTAVWFVVTGYFLFFPRRVATSVRFYRAVFPHRPFWYAFWCAWKQFHGFSTIYIDRYFLEVAGGIQYTSQGLDHIENAVANRTGGIIVMSHAGNWEVAARLLKERGIPLLLFMGKKIGEQAEGLQKESLQQSGVKIIADQPGQASPLDILEGVKYLKRGWILSIAGDRFGPGGSRSSVTADFLGHTIRLPEIPYALALATGVPVFFFFAFRTGRRHYQFIIHEPIYLHATSRQMRRECIKQAAQQYACLLEQAVCGYPFQWHHFEPFLGGKKMPGNSIP